MTPIAYRNLADTHRHGKLNPDEFAVAMHLVYKKLNGQDLPQTLPLDLVPPSTRDLDDMASLMKKEVINNIINKPKAPTIFQTVAGANDVLANSLRSSTTTSTTLPHSSSSSAIAVYEADRAVQESRIAEMNQKIEQKKLDIGLIKPKLAATQKSVKDVKADIAKLKSDILTTNADIEKRLLSAVAKGATAANPLSSSSTSSTSATSLEISRLQTKALQFMQEIESLSEEQKRISQEKAAQLVESARAKEEKRVAENAKNAAAAASSSASSPAPSAAGVGVNLSSLLGAAAAPGSNPADPVACRTAALLAQRMAALGVGGGTSAAAASTATPVAQIASTLSADLEKIESDRRAQQELLERKVGTASSLVERIKKIGSDLQSSYSSASSGPSGTTSTTWEPSSSEILKYEEGIGILSEEANQLIEDMKKTRTKASAASSNSSIFLNSTTAISSTPSSSLFSSTSSYAANNDTTISPPSAPAPTHPPLIPSYSIDRFSSVPIATSSTPSLPPPPPPSSAASMSITSASYTPTYPSNASITSPDSTGSSAAGDQKRRTAAAVSEALAKAEAAIQAVKDRVGKQIDATSSNPFGSSIGSGNAGNGAAVMNGGDSSNPFSSTNMTLKAGGESIFNFGLFLALKPTSSADSNSDPFGQSTSNQQGFERPSVKGELAPATCPTDDVSSSSRTQTTTIVNPSPPTIPAQAPFKIKPQPPHPAPKPKEIPKLPPARPTPVISPDPATVTIVAPPPTTPTYTQQTEIIASAQQQQQIKLEHNKPLGASKVSDLRQSIQASLTSKPTAVESQQPPQIGRDSKTSGISTSSSFASAKKMLEKDLFGGGSFTDNPVSATSSAAVVSSNTQPGITPSKSFNNAKELLQKNLFGAQSSSQLEDDSTDQANNSGPIVVSGAPPPPPPLPPTDNLSSNRSSQASLHSAVSTSNQGIFCVVVLKALQSYSK